jgi:hypothetical protein
MISIRSSTLILIILATSTVVLVPYESSNSLQTKLANAATTPLLSKNNKVGVDKFGITEIYPTTKLNGALLKK